MLGLGSIGYVQSFQYVLINIEPVRPSDYSQVVFLALCVFDFDIPALHHAWATLPNFAFCHRPRVIKRGNFIKHYKHAPALLRDICLGNLFESIHIITLEYRAVRLCVVSLKVPVT